MENKQTQRTFLNNTVYLKKQQTQAVDFYKNDEIMIEQPLSEYTAINQSIVLRSMSSEQNISPKQKQNYFYGLKDFNAISIQQPIPQDQSMKKPKSLIPRLCRLNFPKAIEQYTTRDTIFDDNRRKKRDLLASKAKQRKQNGFQILRQKVHQLMVFQLTEQNESEIQKQHNELDEEVKQYKIQNFLLRQQFAKKQKQILRQMRQFCHYGTIRQS